jgi:integrase/recombinase XerD
MALGKQAKIISDKQVRAVLAELDTRRYPLRDRVIFVLSLKAGMRAKEIASVTWGMVTRCRG